MLAAISGRSYELSLQLMEVTSEANKKGCSPSSRERHGSGRTQSNGVSLFHCSTAEWVLFCLLTEPPGQKGDKIMAVRFHAEWCGGSCAVGTLTSLLAQMSGYAWESIWMRLCLAHILNALWIHTGRNRSLSEGAKSAYLDEIQSSLPTAKNGDEREDCAHPGLLGRAYPTCSFVCPDSHTRGDFISSISQAIAQYPKS